MAKMEIEIHKNTNNLEDLSLRQCSEEKLEAETWSSKTELSDEDLISYDAERFSLADDISMQSNPPSTLPEKDFLESQKAENIMRAAYKEVMAMAMKEKTWVLDTPAVGSVEGIVEMFHTPPPQGSRVECSTESAVLPISPEALISFLMNGEKWASTFSRIVCEGSSEGILNSSNISKIEDRDVIEVSAEFRSPAPFLPRWSTCFVRYKKMVMKNIWAILDVSSDYFTDANSDSTERVEYKRRPSGVIIRENNFNSEVIWIENVEVQEFDLPRNMHPMTFNPYFCFSAKYWISTLLHRLQRRRSQYDVEGELDNPDGVSNIFTTADNVHRAFLETINPFSSESALDLFQEERLRIFKDPTTNHYTASNTFYVPVAPITLYHFLNANNLRFQWSGLRSMQSQKGVARIVSERGSNCITLHMKVDTEEASKDNGYFIQEASLNEYCSFVVSSLMAGSDVRDLLVLGKNDGSDCLKASGFAIIPAEAEGLKSEASLVTACIHGNIEEGDPGIEIMISYMNSIICCLNNCKTVVFKDACDLKGFRII